MRKMLFLLCLIFVPSEGLQVKKACHCQIGLPSCQASESDAFKVATRDGAGEGQKGGG